VDANSSWGPIHDELSAVDLGVSVKTIRSLLQSIQTESNLSNFGEGKEIFYDHKPIALERFQEWICK
jgi:hypothetical protein